MRILLLSAFLLVWTSIFANILDTDQPGHSTVQHEEEVHEHDRHAQHDHQHDHHSEHGTHGEYDPTRTAIHHISDANVINILDAVRIPLPMILYAKDRGWSIFSSGKFHAGHHDNAHYAYDGYTLFEGNVHRFIDPKWSHHKGKVEIESFSHEQQKTIEGKEKEIIYAHIDGHKYQIEGRSTLDGGVLGGGITSFFDFSITKNVVSLLCVALILFLIFRRVASLYEQRDGKAPKGVQSLIEPIIIFIRDDVAKPFIGEHHYEKYLPLLLVLFFFILGLNFWGQIPFFGSANVTGSLTVTMAMAVVVFFVVNLSGNKHYWGHIFWMPGVPAFVKPILAAVEVMGLFIKPLTLMLRLAGNITAGHIAILSFIGLIFILGESGQNTMGAGVGSLLAIPLTMFMMAIEVIVAFVQAYVFTILTASYIGAAVEEHH